MRRVCVVVGSRANYSSIKSVMRAVRAHPDLELQVIAAASALLDRFGSAVDVMSDDGFEPDARVTMIIEGESPATMARSAGLGLLELPTVLERLNPDVVVTVGDRFETISTAIAASYMNITLAHTMGGEVSGSIDESVRHAVTKLAHIHFPASQDAADRIIRMGEDPASVHMVGCPRIDIVKEIVKTDGLASDQEWLETEGVGGHIDVSKDYLMVAQYPVTSEYGDGERQINETLQALQTLELPTIMLWPNADAGSDDVSRGIRVFRERNRHDHIRVYKNFPVEMFVRLLLHSACFVGNSSAAIREGAYLGMPSVNVGTRQAGRERGRNVIDVDYDQQQIVDAVNSQLKHGRYDSDPIYGDGNAGKNIADILATHPLKVQKRITY